jgi:class 3 adenylate cyclase
MSERPTYILTLRPESGVDGLRALRRLLKRLLRDHGLRCVGIEADRSTAATRRKKPSRFSAMR